MIYLIISLYSVTIVRQSIINLEFHEHQDYLCMEGEWGKKKDFLKELLYGQFQKVWLTIKEPWITVCNISTRGI